MGVHLLWAHNEGRSPLRPEREKMGKATQVTEPVVKIQHGPGDHTAIYVLRDRSQKFRMPGVKDDSPRAWDYGPSIIVERVNPQCNETVTYDPDDLRAWKWLGALIAIGHYAMSNEIIESQLPEELKLYWNPKE